ncbi:MAG: rRNA maturation RNase YbeY [Pseudomonadota bacterium]
MSPAIDTDVVVETDAWNALAADGPAGDGPTGDGGLAALAGRCHAAAAAALPALRGTACVLFADDDKLRALNAQFRGVDKPTNVLSFPAGDPTSAPVEPAFLGDVALAAETCAREAGEKGVPVLDHAAHLIVHGLLHLVGYDHQTDDEATMMETLETDILAGLGVAAPYGAPALEARP